MARCAATNDALQRCRLKEGHSGDHAAGPRGTTLRNVRIDDERWEALGDAAEAEGRDRSAVIRDLIDAYIEGRDG